VSALDGELAQLTTAQGWEIHARRCGSLSIGAAAAVFVRPEVATLERSAEQFPAQSLRFAGVVQSLLFDGANSAVLLREQRSGADFRVALPQTGRLADLKATEQVLFGFDPQRAICFQT
jgi:spermidine/putrescine transport system ATP-binding protein